MRKLYVLLLVLFAGFAGRAQTTLLNSNFEVGDAVTWSVANAPVNQWFIGTATANGGVRSAYISNDGGVTNAYTNTVSTVSHIYTPVTFPANQGAIILKFDAKGIGEHLTQTFDYVRVSLTTAPPVAGTMPAVADQLPIFISAQPNFATFWIAIPASYAGTTRNLVFSFRCGGTNGSTAFAIDNVRLTSAVTAKLSGVKTIKTSGGTFGSFSEAIANINAHGASGPLVFNVDAGTTFNETPTAMTTGSVSPHDIIFQKAGSGANPRIVATGSGNSRTTSTGTITTNNDAVIAIVGADGIDFNGIDFASADYAQGTSAIEYGVYVYNASATVGAQDILISNSTITLNRNNPATVGIFQNAAVTPTSTAGANSNNTYHNLTVTNTATGIYLLGNTNFPDLNTQVGTTACTLFNTIGAPGISNDIGNGDFQTWGIRATNQSGVKIFNNKVSNVTSTSSVATDAADGIFIESFRGTSEVYNNNISGIFLNDPASAASASGLRLSHPTTGTHAIRVYNNFVSNIRHGYTGAATVNRYIKGIFISGTAGSTSQSYSIEFNSVRIDGSASPNTSSAAFEVSTTSGPVYTIKNNVFSNFTGAQGTTARHYAFVSTSAGNVGNTGSVMNYNDLYVPNDAGTSGYIARGNATNYATISAFQAAYTEAVNNISINPGFVSATDLHATATALNGTADPNYLTAAPWATRDIDCQNRPATTDMGADEFTPASTPCTAPSNPTNLLFSGITTSAVNGTFTAPAIVPTGYLVVRSSGALTTNPTNGTSYQVSNILGNGVVVSADASLSFASAGLAANTAYTYTVFAFNSANCLGGPVYNTVAPLSAIAVTCPATPASPVVSAQSLNGFQLSFTSSNGGGGSAVSYALEVATDAGFANPVAGSPFTFADTTTTQSTMRYTVTGLNASTTYYYRLKAAGCNPGTVTGSGATSCGASAIPYTESFESLTAANTLPLCMTASPAVAAGGKTQTYMASATGINGALSARTGTKFAAVYWSPSNTAGYFFTAPLQLTAGVTYTASVWYKTDGAAWTDAGIYYGTSPTAAAMTNTVASVSNAAAITYTQISGSFTPAATGVYYVGIRGFNATSTPNYIVFDDISVVATPTCTAPVMTAATSLAYNGATLNWNAASPTPASYEVYYSTSNTPPTPVTVPTVTGIAATSRAITGLAAATTYYAWVRSNCGANGVSDWSAAAVSFTTLCNPVSVPYVENFDGATLPNLPACTSREDVNNDGSTWTTVTAPTGYGGKTLQYTYNVSNAANDWFYTTGINLTAGTSYTLTFKYGNDRSLFVEKMRVYYGTTPSAASMTNLLQNYPAITNSTINTGIINFTPSASGVYYIGFNAYSDANQFNLYLDDITLDATAVCATPLNVSVSGISSTAATVSWTGTGSFVLEYGPAGFTPGTSAVAGTNGTVINPATSPHPLSGLTAGRAYDVYVRRNCTGTGGGYSSNSAKVSFATLPVNDEATGAVVLTQGVYNASCTGTLFTTVGATASAQASTCLSAGQDDDVWFSFVATSNKAILKISNYANASGAAGGFNYALYSGPVGSLSEMDCESSTTVTTANGGGEVALRKPLVAGQTYSVRILTNGTGGRVNFNLCVMTPDVAVTTTANTCVTVLPVTISAANANTNVLVPIYTSDGKLVAEINANGNTLGTVTTKVYRNTGAVRKDNAGKPYLDRNIEITPSVQPVSGTINLRLYFTAAELTALRNTANSFVNSVGDLSVFKNNQPCGGVVNGAAYPLPTSGSAYEINHYVSVNVATFSSFFVASNSFSVLPANLLTFSGVRQGSGNVLKWTVAQEQDVQLYEVERSTDGRSWTMVGSVNSLGNTATQRSYVFTDNNVSGLKQLYRLRQLDVNGAVRLSNTISISGVRAANLTLSGLFPNPVVSKVHLSVEAPVRENVTILVMDAAGRIVKTQKSVVEAGANTLAVNVTGLAQGTYLVKISGENSQQGAANRFVKE